MKSILVLTTIALTSFGSAAQATLAVGDMVRYHMTMASLHVTQDLEQTIEVTAINTTSGTYTQKVTVLQAGIKVSEASEDGDLASIADAENTVDHCSEMPADVAILETITVLGGTFQVCHITADQDGQKLDQYFGKVPFGLIKSIISNTMAGTTTTFELLEFKKY